jgi:hypothetical protein
MLTTRDRINQIGEVLVKDTFVEKKVRSWNFPEITLAKQEPGEAVVASIVRLILPLFEANTADIHVENGAESTLEKLARRPQKALTTRTEKNHRLQMRTAHKGMICADSNDR